MSKKLLPCFAVLAVAAAALVAVTTPEGLVTRAQPAQPAYSLEVVDHVGGAARVVELRGDLLLAGIGPRLDTYDVSRPEEPRLLSRAGPLADMIEDLAVEGSVALAAAGDADVAIYDLSDPARPQVASTLHTPGEDLGVAIEGPIALVGTADRLHVVDVSDPYHPLELGSVAAANGARRIAMRGHRAFVVTADLNDDVVLGVADFLDPHRPRWLTAVADSENGAVALDVALMGDYVLIADGAAGLRVIDAADSALPRQVAVVGAPARAVAVHDARAAVVGHEISRHVSHQLYLVDLSDPLRPQPSLGLADAGYADVALDAGHAYLAEPLRGIEVARAPRSERPSRVALLRESPVWSVAAEAGRVYAIGAADQRCEAPLQVFTRSGGGGLSPTGSITVPCCIDSVVADGGRVYMADCSADLTVADASDPYSPTLSATVDLGRTASDMYADEGRLYLSGGQGGLRILEIGSSGVPSEVASFVPDGAGQSTSVAAGGDLAFVGDTDRGLVVLDVADPSQPAVLGQQRASSGYPGRVSADILDIRADGDYVYAAMGSSGVAIVDVSDPSSPVSVGGVWYEGAPRTRDWLRVRHLAQLGDLLLLPGRFSLREERVAVVTADVSDRTSPVVLGAWLGPMIDAGIAADGESAYLATRDGGLFELRPRPGVSPTPTTTPAPTATPAAPRWRSIFLPVLTQQ